ncbi:hypothetical protein ACKLNR_005108 [Fusarium oxysporum f. sp. zingiberi]
MASVQQQELLSSGEYAAPPWQSTDKEDALDATAKYSPAATKQRIINAIVSSVPNLEKDGELQVDQWDARLPLGLAGSSPPANSLSDHLSSINWLPFDSISVGSLELHCAQEIAHIADGAEDVTMRAYIDPEIGRSLPSIAATPGQTIQQDHVSALITSMATGRLKKT